MVNKDKKYFLYGKQRDLVVNTSNTIRQSRVYVPYVYYGWICFSVNPNANGPRL